MESNIFLQIQDTEATLLPLLEAEAADEQSVQSPPLLMNLPSPGDMQPQPTDGYSFSWFVSRGPQSLGTSLVFPKAFSHIFAMVSNHVVLHNTVLVISSLLTNLTGSSFDDNRRLSNLLVNIQMDILSDDYDDGHIVSVFLLCLLYYYAGNQSEAAIIKNLKGLSLMMRHSQKRRIQQGEDPTPTPIIKLIANQGVEIFNKVRSQHQKTVYFPTTDHMDRSWLKDFINTKYIPVSEPSYTYHNLQFSVLQLYHTAIKIRETPDYGIFPDESVIQQRADTLAADIKTFQRRIVSLNGTISDDSGMIDPGRGYLLLVSYQLLISLTLITHPRLWPAPSERIIGASKLCRLYDALQLESPDCKALPVLSCLFAAGTTFGPQYHPKGIYISLYLTRGRTRLDISTTRQYFWAIPPRESNPERACRHLVRQY